jgi:hypothetical protein
MRIGARPPQQSKASACENRLSEGFARMTFPVAPELELRGLKAMRKLLRGRP